MKIASYMPFSLDSGIIAFKISLPIQSRINSINSQTLRLSAKLKQNSFVKWINQDQESQHSNAIGGACCASTSVAASQSVDDAAQAANGSGAKQYHAFDPHSSADIGSVTATSIANPLILHSCLGLWRELNHLHQKYKNHYQQIKSDIHSNNNFDIRKLVAKIYIKEHIGVFRTEKHLTSWLTAVSSLLVLLKFTADGVLGVGLLLSAIKSLGKVIQRCTQITKKSFDIYNNHKQKQVCKENLNLLNQLNNELFELIKALESKDTPSDFIKKKIEEYNQQLNEYKNDIEISQKDLARYPKLKNHFFKDIQLLAMDGFFWLANASANIGMAVANFISSSHGFPLAAILTLILGSTFGVIYSNNKLLTGRYVSGLTEAESGELNQHSYENFSLEHAEKEFDLNYDLYKMFKDKSRILNKPFKAKSKIFMAKWTIRMLMFLSFGTYTDSMIRIRRKFRAYKATLYKAEDSQLIDWMNEINKLIATNTNANKASNNLFESIKKFEKQEYISKELVFNISKFKSSKFSKIKKTKWGIFWKELQNSSNKNIKSSKTQIILDKINEINQKDFVLLDKYKEFLDYGLLSLDDMKFIFENGPCCIHGVLDGVIDDFYTNLDKLQKSNISKNKIDSLKNKFENLLRQATKSTFGKAGLQYSNRYVSKNASIIAKYQSSNLVKNEKYKHLKYNQQKLNNLKNAKQSISLINEKNLKDQEKMFNNLSKPLRHIYS